MPQCGMSVAQEDYERGALEREVVTMTPAAFPGLPATVFPAMLVPSWAAMPAGLTAVDITAAIAALIWALGGLVALRIAINMSRESDHPSRKPAITAPTSPRNGFRDAA